MFLLSVKVMDPGIIDGTSGGIDRSRHSFDRRGQIAAIAARERRLPVWQVSRSLRTRSIWTRGGQVVSGAVGAIETALVCAPSSAREADGAECEQPVSDLRQATETATIRSLLPPMNCVFEGRKRRCTDQQNERQCEIPERRCIFTPGSV